MKRAERREQRKNERRTTPALLASTDVGDSARRVLSRCRRPAAGAFARAGGPVGPLVRQLATHRPSGRVESNRKRIDFASWDTPARGVAATSSSRATETKLPAKNPSRRARS